jgi:hypothetical protein
LARAWPHQLGDVPGPDLVWPFGEQFRLLIELRQALLAFRDTYNSTWLIERHGFLTPAQFRQKQLQSAAIAA